MEARTVTDGATGGPCRRCRVSQEDPRSCLSRGAETPACPLCPHPVFTLACLGCSGLGPFSGPSAGRLSFLCILLLLDRA